MAEHESVLFDIHDAKVYPVVTLSGASPVYGAAVDIFGIGQASVSPNLITAELKGDGKVIASKSKIDKFNVSLTYGRLSLDVLEVVLGATVTDPDSGEAKAQFLADVDNPEFKLAFSIEDADNGIDAVHVTLFRTKVTGGTFLSQQSDQFGQPTLDTEAIGLVDIDGTDLPDFPTDLMAEMQFFTTDPELPA